MPRGDKPHAAIAATLGAATLWGTSFITNDAGLAHVGPASFAALRFILAGIIALAALIILKRWSLAPLRTRLIWTLALTNGAAFLMQYYAQTGTTPARTALFVNSTAFAVAILERILHKQRLGPWRIASLITGVAGASILVAASPGALQGGQLWGDLLALASGLTWAIYFVHNRTAVRQHDPILITGWTFALTGILLLPAALLDDAPLQASPQGWLAIAYAGILTTALAYGLWAYGLRHIAATASAVLLLFEILVASLLSLAIGRERFGPTDYVGAALLVAALIGMTIITEKRGDEAKT